MNNKDKEKMYQKGQMFYTEHFQTPWLSRKLNQPIVPPLNNMKPFVDQYGICNYLLGKCKGNC